MALGNSPSASSCTLISQHLIGASHLSFSFLRHARDQHLVGASHLSFSFLPHAHGQHLIGASHLSFYFFPHTHGQQHVGTYRLQSLIHNVVVQYADIGPDVNVLYK